MSMRERIKYFLKKIAPQERCPHRLALASSLSIYISFSPFFGLHTIMHIVFGWFLGLNIPLLLAVGYGVNNPWTMVPVYMSGYLCGYWMLHSCLGFSIASSNPPWMDYINSQLGYYLGIVDVSFWAFMIGANVLGVALALISYPFFRNFFAHLLGRRISF
jgi:uncharacterized protein